MQPCNAGCLRHLQHAPRRALRARAGRGDPGQGNVVGGCIRGPRTKTSYAGWFLGKPAIQSS
jgi:hypothetical protein